MANTMVEECHHCGLETDCILNSESEWTCEECMIKHGYCQNHWGLKREVGNEKQGRDC